MPQVSMSDEELRKRKTKSGSTNMGTLLTGFGGTTNTTQGGVVLGASNNLSGAPSA